MKEDVFFKVGYTTYLQKSKVRKINWTSRFAKKIMEHKVISVFFVVITMCIIMNFWLVYRFISVLENCH